MNKGNTRDYGRIIRERIDADPKLADEVDEEDFNAEVAVMIYEARVAVGLTQKDLAELIGTHQSVIARLEDADYSGHSLPMLRKIAAATHRRLRLDMFPEDVGCFTEEHEATLTAESEAQWDNSITLWDDVELHGDLGVRNSVAI